MPEGRSVGWANVASTMISPEPAVTIDPSITAVTVSWTLLKAKAIPTPAVPLQEAPILPASAAIEAVSWASTDTEPAALTSEYFVPTALIWASTVFLMVLTANEPPKALPPPVAAAPPTTTLMFLDSSVALTVTLPAVDFTVAPSIRATTELRMSLTPIEALTAAPLPSDKPSEPVPE